MFPFYALYDINKYVLIIINHSIVYAREFRYLSVLLQGRSVINLLLLLFLKLFLNDARCYKSFHQSSGHFSNTRSQLETQEVIF